jgi:hypothetical protein
MKINIYFAYSAILIIYIFIIIQLYLPNTETIGLFTLFVWFILSHTFIFSQFKNFSAFAVSIVLLMSLIFVNFYFMRKIFAQDVSLSNIPPTNHEEKIVIDNFKIIFIVSEFLLLLYIILSNINVGFKTNISNTFFTFVNIFYFSFFILLFYIFSNYSSDSQKNKNIESFKWAFGTTIILNFIIWFIFSFIVYFLLKNLNLYDANAFMSFLIKYFFECIFFLSILLMSFYSLDMSYWLYSSSELIIN